MSLKEMIEQQHLTRYKVAKMCNIPQSTMRDLCSGKTDIKKASVETLYKLAKAFSISMEELLLKLSIDEKTGKPLDQSYLEYDLPIFLQDSIHQMNESWEKIDAGKEDSIWDCNWCDLQSSINICEVEQLITSEQANFLRKKYLRMEMANND
ncbi:MAG: helix-turn-helix transcriptional regulator [Bulleidia sp.]|nr:helix-turn-helix domain-containing protein [Erysipelotrichaceae bacterium]MDY2780455.1 helix-turn-helix transcriptional regulator [Bulleidia sp.]